MSYTDTHTHTLVIYYIHTISIPLTSEILATPLTPINWKRPYNVTKDLPQHFKEQLLSFVNTILSFHVCKGTEKLALRKLSLSLPLNLKTLKYLIQNIQNTTHSPQFAVQFSTNSFQFASFESYLY